MSNILQNTYGRRMPIGAAGMAATEHGWDADTRQAEGTIVFGRACSKGDEDDGVVQGGSLFVGVSIRDITLDHDTADQYEEGDNVAIMTRGDIWVVVSGAVEAQTRASYNTSTGLIGASGTAIAGSYFKTSADDGELAILRLNDGSDVTT